MRCTSALWRLRSSTATGRALRCALDLGRAGVGTGWGCSAARRCCDRASSGGQSVAFCAEGVAGPRKHLIVKLPADNDRFVWKRSSSSRSHASSARAGEVLPGVSWGCACQARAAQALPEACTRLAAGSRRRLVPASKPAMLGPGRGAGCGGERAAVPVRGGGAAQPHEL